MLTAPKSQKKSQEDIYRNLGRRKKEKVRWARLVGSFGIAASIKIPFSPTFLHVRISKIFVNYASTVWLYDFWGGSRWLAH